MSHYLVSPMATRNYSMDPHTQRSCQPSKNVEHVWKNCSLAFLCYKFVNHLDINSCLHPARHILIMCFHWICGAIKSNGRTLCTKRVMQCELQRCLVRDKSKDRSMPPPSPPDHGGTIGICLGEMFGNVLTNI